MRNRSYFDDNKVGELVNFALQQIPLTIVSQFRPLPEIRAAYNSYGQSVERMHLFARFLPWTILHSVSYGERAIQAVYAETGSVEFTAKAKEKEADINMRMRLIERDEPPMTRVQLKRTIPKVSAVTKDVIDCAPAKLKDGTSAIMPSIVVLAWTAFEAMCEDLLETAIDLRPRWLSPLKGRSSPRKLRPYESMSLKGKTRATSPNSAGHGKRDKLSYRSLEAIRDSYYVAFSAGPKRIDAALSPRHLDTLYAVRNIIVHKAGNVDKMFLSRVAGLPEYAHAKEDQPLNLDFHMVRSIVEPSIISGIRLVVAVNKWLLDHPDSKAP
jgi:hypothetical protein